MVLKALNTINSMSYQFTLDECDKSLLFCKHITERGWMPRAQRGRMRHQGPPAPKHRHLLQSCTAGQEQRVVGQPGFREQRPAVLVLDLLPCITKAPAGVILYQEPQVVPVTSPPQGGLPVQRSSHNDKTLL